MSARFAVIAAALFALTATPIHAAAPAQLDGPALASACAGRDGWTDPAPPARLYGNTWLVGTCGIMAVLVTSPEGHILIDGGPPEAVPLIAANIRRAGFALRDVKWLLSTHEHPDHAGGLAELQRLTGAALAASPDSAAVFRSGRPASLDPQAVDLKPVPIARVDRVLGDGDVVRLGPLALTAHFTQAHSLGSTSWTWESCDGGGCRTIALVDSLTTVSADGYRFSDHPQWVAMARIGIDAARGLPCDLLITPHPAASNLMPRLAGDAPLFDSAACSAYAARAEAALDDRLARETRR